MPRPQPTTTLKGDKGRVLDPDPKFPFATCRGCLWGDYQALAQSVGSSTLTPLSRLGPCLGGSVGGSEGLLAYSIP